MSSTMQTNAHEAQRAALTALIDYAGLFPPAKLAMPQAIDDYIASRAGSYAWMLGRFIMPLSRLNELLTIVPAGERIALSVILDGGAAGVERVAQIRESEKRVSVEALEIAAAPRAIGEFAGALRAAGLEGMPAFIEVPRDASWENGLGEVAATLARYALGAKIRCGGLEAAAFPSPREVALFLTAMTRAGVPFKATAGLHHPVRHENAASGFVMHGFLNLLGASALARTEPLDRVEAVVACMDPAQFVFGAGTMTAAGHRIEAEQLTAARRSAFVAYGSCSFAEPVDDLRAAGGLA